MMKGAVCLIGVSVLLLVCVFLGWRVWRQQQVIADHTALIENLGLQLHERAQQQALMRAQLKALTHDVIALSQNRSDTTETSQKATPADQAVETGASQPFQNPVVSKAPALKTMRPKIKTQADSLIKSVVHPPHASSLDSSQTIEMDYNRIRHLLNQSVSHDIIMQSFDVSRSELELLAALQSKSWVSGRQAVT